MCTRIIRTYQRCCRFSFVSYKSSVGSGLKKKCLKKLNNLDEKIRRDSIRRENCIKLH